MEDDVRRKPPLRAAGVPPPPLFNSQLAGERQRGNTTAEQILFVIQFGEERVIKIGVSRDERDHEHHHHELEGHGLVAFGRRQSLPRRDIW